MGRKSMKTQRRAEIISTFCEVAKSEGVENTSLVKIANKMGVNVSLTLHYFKSKRDLLVAVCENILRQYSEIFRGYDEPDKMDKEQLLKLIDIMFSRNWNELFDDGLYFSFYSMIYRTPELKEEFKDVHDSLHRKFADILCAASNKGLVRIDNSLDAAIDIFTILDGWYYYIGMVEEEALMVRRRQRCIEWVHNILGL